MQIIKVIVIMFSGIFNDHVFRRKTVRFLHWVIAALITFNYSIGLIMNHITGHKAFYLYDFHLQTGLILLCLVAMRVLWKYTTDYKKIASKLLMAKSLITEYLYILIYSLILAISILGIIFVQAKGRHLVFLEIFNLPIFIEKQPRTFTRGVFQWHKWLSHVIVGLACLHVLNMFRYKFGGQLKKQIK
jgi:cytochrome b561